MEDQKVNDTTQQPVDVIKAAWQGFEHVQKVNGQAVDVTEGVKRES